MKLTGKDKRIFANFKRIDEQYNKSSNELEEFCLSRVKEFTDNDDFDGAIQYLNLMPDSLARVYVADYIRVQRGDYEN